MKFKPCPFCQNDEQDDKTIQCHQNGEYWEAEVECDQCDCVGPFSYMAKTEQEAKDKAVEFWNWRKEDVFADHMRKKRELTEQENFKHKLYITNKIIALTNELQFIYCKAKFDSRFTHYFLEVVGVAWNFYGDNIVRIDVEQKGYSGYDKDN